MEQIGLKTNSNKIEGQLRGNDQLKSNVLCSISNGS